MLDLNQPGRAYRVLDRSFYLGNDVVKLAQLTLGKMLITRVNGLLSAGIITETEAYAGESDRASHAFGGRRTARTEIMYKQGGIAYVYLCYGVHSLFNIVTNKINIPHAILIRGIMPVAGIEWMMDRSAKNKIGKKAGIGPGNVTRLLGIHYSGTGTDLCTSDPENGNIQIWLEDHGIKPLNHEIEITTRVGVNYAGEDAKLPYRFIYHIPDTVSMMFWNDHTEKF